MGHFNCQKLNKESLCGIISNKMNISIVRDWNMDIINTCAGTHNM